MQLMYKKFTAALLAFLMIFSMGGMLRPLAQTNTSQAQTTQEPKVNGDDKIFTIKIYINETNFPDANFRDYLLNNTDWIKEGNDKYYTMDQIRNIKTMDCSDKGIKSLEGIQYFVDLTELVCGNNPLTSLDVSNNTDLVFLSCCGDKLRSLDVSNNTDLETLFCWDNQLTSLDVSNNTNLEGLRCNDNQLTSLDVSKLTALGFLECQNNQLTSLDVSKNTDLIVFDCDNNKLTSIDLSKNKKLNSFYGGTQNPSTNLYKHNGLYTVDFKKEIIPNGNLSRVLDLSQPWILNILDGTAFYNSSSADPPTNLTYYYITGCRGCTMQVNLKLNIK